MVSFSSPLRFYSVVIVGNDLPIIFPLMNLCFHPMRTSLFIIKSVLIHQNLYSSRYYLLLKNYLLTVSRGQKLFKMKIYFMCMCIFFACICVERRRGHKVLGTGVTEGCELGMKLCCSRTASALSC